MKKNFVLLAFVAVVMFFGFGLFTTPASAEMTELSPVQMKQANVAFGFYDYVAEDSRDPFEDQKSELIDMSGKMVAVHLPTRPDSYSETIKVREGMEIAGMFEVGSTVFHSVLHSDEGITSTSSGYVNVTAAGTSTFGPSTMTVYHHEYYSQTNN